MNDYILEYVAEKERADRLESILLQQMNSKELRKSEHMFHLEQKNKRLKQEVRAMQEKAEHFNRMLYATGLIVNCTGCDAGKPFDGENLTEEKVIAVECIADRLRRWWNNYKHRNKGKE